MSTASSPAIIRLRRSAEALRRSSLLPRSERARLMASRWVFGAGDLSDWADAPPAVAALLAHPAQTAASLRAAVEPFSDAPDLAVGLTNTYISSDLVELHAAPVVFTRTPGEKPLALASARTRIALGGTAVANRRHELVKLADLDVRLAPLLDGTRTRPQLADALTAKAAAGELRVQKDGQPLTDPGEIREALTAVLDQALRNLANQALLIG